MSLDLSHHVGTDNAEYLSISESKYNRLVGLAVPCTGGDRYSTDTTPGWMLWKGGKLGCDDIFHGAVKLQVRCAVIRRRRISNVVQRASTKVGARGGIDHHEDKRLL